MLADLDLLLTTVFCTADDLLAQRAKNARRRLTPVYLNHWLDRPTRTIADLTTNPNA